MASPLPNKIAGRTGALLQVEADGAINANIPTSGGKDTEPAGVDITTAGTSTLIAAVPGYRIKVVGILLMSKLDQDITLLSGSAKINGAGEFPIPAKGGWAWSIGGNTPICQTNIGEALAITTTVATQLSGFVVYFLEA